MKNWRQQTNRLGAGFDHTSKLSEATSAGFSRTIIFIVISALVMLGGFLAFTVYTSGQSDKFALQPSDNFGVQDIPLEGLVDPNSFNLSTLQSLSVNGQLRANNSLIIAPTARPAQASIGQVYYDREGNGFAYFDGTEFVAVTDANDIAELQTQLQTQINALQAGLSQTPSLPADLATQSGNNTFSGTNVFSNGLSASTLSLTGAAALQDTLTVNGQTTLGPTTASSLVLSSPLGVGSGGTGATSFTTNGVVIGQGSSPLTTVNAPGPGLCLISTGGAPSFQVCPGGVAAVVESLNGLQGNLSIANASGAGAVITIDNATTIAKGIASFNATNFSVTAGAVNTIQDIAVTSTPTFAGLTLNGSLTIGGNSIVTSGATISSAELDVLDGGILESEVSGVITDVTAGSGLTGGAASGNATVNIASANGGITVNADNIALTLQPAGDGLSATTSSGSGFEILAGGLTLLQGCSDTQVLKWNEATDTWSCATDAGSGGLGDDIFVNGSGATNANFIDTVASGTTAGVAWALNTTPSPDDISLTVSNASGIQAGVVTTGIQSFGGDKTFNAALITTGLFTANGNFTLETGDTFTVNGDTFTDLTGTGLTIAANALQTTLGIAIDSSEITDLTVVGGDIANDTITDTQLAFNTGQNLTVSSTPSFAGITLTGNLALGANSITTSGATISSAELDVLDGGILESEVSGVVTDVTAGNGLTGGSASGNATVNIGAGSGITVNADDVSVDATVCRTSGNCVGVAGSGDILQGGNTFGVAMTIGTNDAQDLILETSNTPRLTITSTGAATFSSSVAATSFSGNGSSLTSLNASNLSSGTVDTGRISGSYTGITGLGTITVGTWQGGAIADAYLQDNITVSSAGVVDWTALNNYPAACSAGQAITQLGDTVTCTAFAAASGSGSYIQNTVANQNTANFNIQSAAVGSVTAKLRALGGQTADVIQIRDATDTSTVFAVTPAGAVTATSFAGDGASLTSLNASNLSSGTLNIARIADNSLTNAKLQNSTLTVTAGNGLGGGGSAALGGSTSLSVTYGSGANTSVQGNIQLTCASGTGNLSGGGNAVTLGSGGTCGNITIASSPVFAGTVTIQGGVATIGADGQQGSTVLYDGGVGGAAHTGTVQVIGSLGQNTTYILPDPATGSATICLSTGNCAGSGGGVTTPGGVSGNIAKFTGAGSIDDSTLSESGSTLTATGNLVIQGANSLALGTSSSFDGSVTFRTAAGANTVSLQAPSSNPASNLTFRLPSAYGSNGDCLQSDGSGGLAFTTCTGGAGGGVTSIDGQTGVVAVSNATGNAGVITIDDATTAAKGIASFNASNFSVTSGAVSIATGGVGSTELATNAVTTIKIADSNVTNAKLQNSSLTVTAGNGLGSGGSVTLGGSTTLNITSANGGIVVNADDIALTLQPSGDGLSSTTSSGSGFEILTSGLTLLQGCADGELLKWNETTDVWARGTDSGSGGLGDDVSVGGANATNANFIDTVASGATAGVAWALNTTPNPDEISLTVSNASGTVAGVVTTGIQSFAGDKTFGNALNVSGLFSATGGVTIETGDVLTFNGDAFTDLTGTGLTISAGVLQSTLGITIDSSEIADLTVVGGDIANDTITDAQLAFDTGQHLTISSTPSFASLIVTGNTTANRPASPAEGQVYYDTTTKQLLTYANGKWQADRTDAVIVAASNSTQANKDAADYVGDGNTGAANDGDQIQINSALTAGTGKKIVLLAGTYTIDASVSIPNNTTLAGVGSGSVITIPNGINANFSAVVNTDQTTGTNVTVKDLLLEGNAANQSGTNIGMAGIDFNGLGSGAALTTIQGARISNVQSNNWYSNGTISNCQAGAGICLRSSVYGVISNSSALGNANGIRLSASAGITISNNNVQGNTYGIRFVTSSNYNTIANNVISGNSWGVALVGGNGNAVNSNQIIANTSNGLLLDTNANTNAISANKFVDNGSTTTNNAVYIFNSDSNSITSNSVSDASASSNNYAINIFNVGSDTNYLADNSLGGGTINDAGTGTVYGGQVDGSTNYVIQPAGTVELMKNTNVTGTLNITSNVDTNGSLTVGNADQFVISNLGVVTAGTWQGTAINDTYVADTLTVNSSSTVDWQALSNYPAACGAGTAITQLGDTVTCTAFAAGSGSGNYIQNQNASQQSVANFWISGTGRVDTALQAPTFDTATAVALTLGGNAISISVVDDTVLAAGKSLTITGGATGTRPGSPTAGMLYYDSTTNQLLQWNGTKWVSDRSTATKIIAPSNASQTAKDSADVILTGTADQTLINTALTAAAGGKIYILEGTVTISGSISVPNNTTLAGAGAGTLITIPNTQNGTYSAITNTTTGGAGTGVVIQDLRLDGNNSNQTSGTMRGIGLNGMGSGTGASAVQGAKISNVWVNNWQGGYGISLVSSSNNTVSGVSAKGNDQQGIFLTTSSTHNTVTGNTSQGNGTSGIYLSSSSAYNTITGNTTQGNVSSGIEVFTDENTISGNTAQGNGASGILMSNNAGNTITGNTLAGNTGPGIVLSSNSDSNTITGNTARSNGGSGIELLSGSDNNAITSNTTQSNAISGIYVSGSTNNTLTSNTTRTNSSSGIYLTGSTNNTITGNTADTNFYAGIELVSSSNNNSISGNTNSTNGSFGIYLGTSSNTNTITGNKIHDSGGAASNNGIYLSASDSNLITSNGITDTSATTDNYAVNIFNGTSDTNYLADNTLGTGSVNNIGTGTVFGGQVNSTGNYVVQPAGTIELMKNTNVTGTLTATTLTLTNDLAVSEGGTGASSFTSNGILYGNGTGAVGVTAAGTTGQCLLATTGSAPTWGTCTVASLQGTYNASSPATIDLSNSKDFTINATEQTTDSSIVFNLQCVTCSASGGRFAIQDAGVDIFKVNPNGDIVVGTATNNITFAAASNYELIANGSARHTKRIYLTPEFNGSVLDIGGCTGSSTGTMTGGLDLTNRKHYYKWTTAEVAAQCYEVAVQVMLPSDFAGWSSTTPLQITAYRTSTGTILAELRDTAGAVETNVNYAAFTPGTASTWTTTTSGVLSGTYAANGTIELRIRLTAPTSGDTRLSNITLDYLSKW